MEEDGTTERNVGVRGSTMKYNATYFVTSDEDSRVVDDGEGYSIHFFLLLY